MTNGFVLATDPMLPPHGLEGAVYAIGNFDGLHLGHQAVIGRAVALAKERAGPSALLTFEPHPADFFAGRSVVFRLTPSRDQAAICARLGLTGLVLIRFDAALAAMSADEFIDEAGIVSSSAIRKALEGGDLAAAARGLGRNYSVSGQVISGQRLGRTLGVPTANIALEPTNRLAHGIYAVIAWVDGRAFPAVASFGTRPTVDDGPPLLEVHLLDFDGDLYGREMEVEFVERIRDELKFDSLDALVAEMNRDKERARVILEGGY
jgi:riboflavin kinase/FMN adenylyltransferase